MVTTTALSVGLALGIGTIEYLQVTSERLHLSNAFFAWLNGLDFETLGYVIVGTFLLTWILSVVLFKLRRMEERWGPRLTEPGP